MSSTPAGNSTLPKPRHSAAQEPSEEASRVERMLRHHAAMYDWSKRETRAINDYILTVREGIAEELAAANTTLLESGPYFVAAADYEALREDFRVALRLIAVGADDSDGWSTADLIDAQELLAKYPTPSRLETGDGDQPAQRGQVAT